MTTIKEITKELSASHVVSFERSTEKVVVDKRGRKHSERQYAGYSPANGLYWVAGESFGNPEEAARKMLGIGEWTKIDQCIDFDEVF